MLDKRNININNISDQGLLLGRIDKFVLLLHKDGKYEIVNTARNSFSDLSHVDLVELKTLLEFGDDWHAAHHLVK